MKKAFLFVTLVSLGLVACSSKPKSTEIKGKLTNSTSDKIYLEELTTAAVVMKDSAVVNKKGEFTMYYNVSTVGFYRLKVDNSNYVILILDSLDRVEVTGDATKMADTYKVKGSKNSEQLCELNIQLRKNYIKADSLQKVFKDNQSSPKRDSIGSILEKQYNIIIEGEAKFVKDFIAKYPTSFANLAAIERLSPEKDVEYYKKLDENLYAKYPKSAYVQAFHTRVEQMKTQLVSGVLAPEITLNNPEGKPVSLSSLRGKYVLIDFWASWCRPCRAENPNVVKLFNQYHDKGFEVFSVSLDKEKGAWVKAIADDKLTWTHVSDLGFWNSSVVKPYGVQSIPLTFLLDKEGKIIAKGLRGDQLAAKLAELMP